MTCSICPRTDWFEIATSCGLKFGKTSKAFKQSDQDIELAMKYAEYRLPPEEIYFYVDDDIAIFKDIHPSSKFHILVVPIMHIEQLDELTLYPEILYKMFKVSTDLVTSFNDMRECHFSFNFRNELLIDNFTKHVHLQITSQTLITKDQIKKFFKNYKLTI